MITNVKITVSVLTILLLMIDGYCLVIMQRNVKRKNGKEILKYCKTFFIVSAFVCFLLFGYVIFEERLQHPELSLHLLIIKASWTIWAFIIAALFAGNAFWKKGKSFEEEEDH